MKTNEQWQRDNYNCGDRILYESDILLSLGRSDGVTESHRSFTTSLCEWDQRYAQRSADPKQNSASAPAVSSRWNKSQKNCLHAIIGNKNHLLLPQASLARWLYHLRSRAMKDTAPPHTKNSRTSCKHGDHFEALKKTESPFIAQHTPDEEAASVRAAKVAPRSQLQRSWWKVMARHKETGDLNIGREER